MSHLNHLLSSNETGSCDLASEQALELCVLGQDENAGIRRPEAREPFLAQQPEALCSVFDFPSSGKELDD